MKKNKIKAGDIIAIPLAKDFFAFGRVLKSVIAFYDLSADRILAPEQIVKKSILFRIWVMDKAIKSGRWKVIGNAPLEEGLQVPVDFFRQDALSKKLYVHREGKERPATREECMSLEPAAVWSAEHVEDRLNDHFKKRPNIWVESMRLE